MLDVAAIIFTAIVWIVLCVSPREGRLRVIQNKTLTNKTIRNRKVLNCNAVNCVFENCEVVASSNCWYTNCTFLIR